jgi:HAD superfamily hydrolase (TIGR01509 family)
MPRSFGNILDMGAKAICFDLDGVYFTPQGKNSFHQALSSEFGMPKEVADELMYRSIEMAQLVRGQISSADFWNRFREIAGITVTDEELAARWIRDYEVDQKVRSAVLKARALGYKTCVCTNNNAIRLPRLMEKFKLADDFDVIVSSHEVGETKPHKEIFEELLRRLDVRAEELIYADDNPDRLQGARDLGIQTFVFENFDQFIDELVALGVDLR